MRIKWGNEKIKGFSSPVKTAERKYDWIVWAVIVICGLAGIGYSIWQVIK